MKPKNNIIKKLSVIFKKFEIKNKLKELYQKSSFPKVRSSIRFVNLIIKYIFGSLVNYQFSANTIFDEDKDKKAFYNLIKQDKYNFDDLLKDEGYKILKEYIDRHNKHNEYDSWCTNNRLTLVLDKMECGRTTDNFEKGKKLYKSENGHYLINLLLVIGDSREKYILRSVLYDPDDKKTSVERAFEMLKECIEYIKRFINSLNRVRISADREFFTKKIMKYFNDIKVRFVTRAKNNTVFYDDDFKFNTRWLKYFLYRVSLDEFKSSSQLDSWCKKHNRPKYKYWSKVFKSNFGLVKVVAIIKADKELVESNYNRNIQILVSNDTKMNAIQIIQTYKGQRWQVEVFHKSFKKDIEVVKSYTGISFIGIKHHCILRALSHLYLTKYISEKKTWKKTIGKNKMDLVKLVWYNNFIK